MTQITASMVNELRQKTGVGMMDCKKALVETNGDFEAAIDFLRKKGLSKAQKKAGRVTAEGVISIAFDGNKGAIVEVNAETDFVARNADFQDFAKNVALTALTAGADVETLKNTTCANTNKTVADVLTDKIASIGENLSIRRSAVLNADVVTGYIHGSTGENMGKIGVLVGLKGSDTAALEEVGKKVAMHIAAAKPDFLSTESVDAKTVEKERNFLKEEALASGKPEAVVDQMLVGRMKKFYSEIVLLEQAFVMEPKKTVKEIVAEAGAELTGFKHFILGDGIEKKSESLADEVAKQLA
ncbi:MAG: elongation factor Ts [Alphaproteobacteria bacterium]|nr:elongation factor Ts [Alphaproteobacteria bacterium]MBN2779652.1 elongation factor Ts [Alphaproteobacteria bacterium]